jgi:hypothetical protein
MLCGASQAQEQLPQIKLVLNVDIINFVELSPSREDNVAQL